MYTMKYLMGFHQGDSFFCNLDIGWVVGHTFMVYGPLLTGGTTVLYDGQPIGTPDAGKIWRVAEKYKVRNLFTKPSVIRSIHNQD